MTPNQLNVSGMTAWAAIDDLELMDPANGALVISPYLSSPFGGMGPPAGKTTYTGMFTWPIQMQLLQAGDTVDIWQLHTAGDRQRIRRDFEPWRNDSTGPDIRFWRYTRRCDGAGDARRDAEHRLPARRI